jgi:2-keto-4-pentenoate hydratase/2-oxohepta-3-ene-1,7-dioic acid hydratase in catechol pathway
MNIKRRDFLKQSSLAGAMAIAGAGTFQSTPAGAATAGGGARPDSPVMPKGMTLLTMQSGGVYSLGVKTERGIVDVRRAARVLKSSAPTTMDQLISGGDQGLTDVVSRALAAPSGGGLVRDERKVAFGPCVTNPEKIVCVGLNYARHAKEVGQPLPKMPILFNKFNNSLNAHQGVVRVSSIPAEKFDYEAELVIVMGRKANNVSEAEALSYVFGYATGNDFTARDLQSRSSQWMIGKSCDGFGLIGPYIVTADQVDPGNLKIEGTVNGEVRQSSNTNDLVFNCAQIISYASKLMTLQPGDLIYTGTPEGVISGYPKEKQVWLKPGDRLTTTIEKLGELRFTLV